MGTGYELIARVGKTRGLEGKVTVHETGGLPLCIYEGLVVHVVPPTLYGPRQLTVAGVAELGDSTVVAEFEEVTDIEVAAELTGRYLLARVDDLDFGEDEEAWLLIGREVEDERYGMLGTVVEFIETPANDVLVIDGPYGEVLIPVIEDVIVDVPDDDDAPLVTHVMDGLIDTPAPEGE